MNRRYLLAIPAILLVTACESQPIQEAAPKEEVTTVDARVIRRNNAVDPEYEKRRQAELGSRETGQTIGKIGGLIGAVIANATDTTNYPQRYHFVVRLDATRTIDVIDIYPFEVGQCVRVVTGKTTGKMTLLTGYTGACDSIPNQ